MRKQHAMQRLQRSFGPGLLPLGLLVGLATAACGDDSTGSGGAGGSGSDATSASGTTTGTTAGSGSTSTAGPTTDASSSSSSGGDGGAGVGGGEGGSEPVVCTQARTDALGAIEEVSEGEVLVLEEGDGEATIWVDATAGGLPEQANNPWIYVDFTTLGRVDVDDVQADSDTTWDLALKRPVLRANNHDGGLAGEGASAHLDAEFDDVTADDIDGADFELEGWFDEDCNLRTDQTGSIFTSFSGDANGVNPDPDGWYQYANAVVTPAPGTWLVRGGSGDEVFKIAILDYYANDDGTSGQAGGRFLIRVAPLAP
jgi:hypothetical protein